MMSVISRDSKFVVICLVLLVLQSFTTKLFFIDSGSIINQLDELILVFILTLSVVFLFRNKKIKLDRYIICCFLIYWLIAFLSSIFGSVKLGQFFLQTFLDLKFFVGLLFCIVFYDRRLDLYICKFFKLLIILNIPFVAWQFLLQGSYDFIFSNGSHFGLVYTADGEEKTRAVGVFWFTGIYALFCALSAGYFLASLLRDKTEISSWCYFILSWLLLMMSLSRGEIASAVVSSILLLGFYFGKQNFKPVAAFSASFVTLIVLVLYSDSVVRWAVELGLLSGAVEMAPRALFMQTAIEIGSEFFPLGAGLGAFGGKAAVDYDSVYFYQYLISREWYFNFGMFLTDTFWPKVIAESGFLGMCFLLSGIVLLFRLIRGRDISSLYSLFALSFMLVNSISTPIFNDLFSVILAFCLIGKSISFENNEPYIQR